ncbi:sulfurtransferase [Mycobacterium sp. AZCC_0083]|uniref:sulfurtransferase n=1 Tax=Mycobacterium sp. AZCC_0083 TaxID=2735882 RepID=UPI001616D1C7|nr:rhodanese-like domain-containing protein [Mycobacterium sp. AZCC_0083]MBB5163913.1 thiosulfate/3-mercaptopyruvate sulfurtransferase [Mycobacterium sp. AZCC_0083]
MSREPFISAHALDQMRTSAAPPVIFDATLVLHKARFDGDFHAESGRSRWEEAHVPGSVHVEVDTELSVPDSTHDRHPPPQVLADTLARLGVGQETPVVVYDSTGGLWAARVWYLLRWIGVPVGVLDGGLTGWRESGLPVESGLRPESVPVSRWEARVAYHAWIDKDELLQFGEFSGNLVCGLSSASFSGSEPTRYSRRGHIPGSINVPARSLFDDSGFIRSRAEVTARYRDADVDLDTELLLYCGGGISAAANALALSSIGFQHARVYDGSLEEWSADPDLPLIVS